MTQGILRAGLVALCTGLAIIVIAEVSMGAVGSTASLTPAANNSAPLEMSGPADIDAMVAGILERPLFASSRLPYEEAVATDEVEDEETPQQLRVRLMGVAILPEGREALFEREGSKPAAVKEGGQIEGWTVKAIRTDHVVLSNAMGEEVLEPTNAAPGISRPRVAANGAQAKRKGAPPIPQPASSRTQDQQ